MKRKLDSLGKGIVLVISLAVFVGVPDGSAQGRPLAPVSTETELIAKEKGKFDAIKNGTWNDLRDMFAEDYRSIGYRPDGTVRMVNKAQSFAPENKLPVGIGFVLSEFNVIFADKNSAVVTYLAEGPIKIHATSVWARRDKEWKTIFYQATMTK
jgi:hypothetical protein